MKYKSTITDNGVAWEEEGVKHIRGYASVFNVVDAHGDVVVKGAFSNSLDPEVRKERNLGPVRFLMQHRHDGDPIGSITKLEETEKGLYFEASFLDTPLGQQAYKEVSTGARDTFSIGYHIVSEKQISKQEAKKQGYAVSSWHGDTVNLVTEVNLCEISPVLFASNSHARVGVKQYMPTLKVKQTFVDRTVTFEDDGDIIRAVVVEEFIDQEVETEAGTLDPIEGDPILKLDILVVNDEGVEEQSGEIVYAYASSVDFDEEESTQSETESSEEEKSKPKARILPRTNQETKQSNSTATVEAKANTNKDDEIMPDKNQMVEAIQGLMQKQAEIQEKQMNEVVQRLEKIEQKNRPSANMTAQKTKSGSIASRFLTDEGVVLALKSGRTRTDKVNVKSLFTKADTDLAVTLGGNQALTDLSVDRSLGIIESPRQERTLRDLIRKANTKASSVSYVESVGYANLAAVLTTQASSSATTIVVDSVSGFYVGQTITLSQGKTNEEDAVVSVITESTNTITLEDALGNTHAALSIVSADKFVFTPETKIKPRAKIGFEAKTAAVKTLAHWVPITKQALDDLDGLQSYIEGELLEGLKDVEEWQILFGDGSGDQLEGIMTNSRIGQYAWANGVASDTKVDALRRSITLAHASKYRPDTIVLSIEDWEDIELNKGFDGHYIQTSVNNGLESTLWKCRVLATPNMPAGTALVGGFAIGATLWDRQDATIDISDQHDDFFVRNMLAIRAEERIALTVQRPEAFVAVDLSDPPEGFPGKVCCGGNADDGGDDGDG